MTLDFLIVALPRSGSAWLANFLTYGPVFCYHEPCAEATAPRARDVPIVGGVDTGCWMFRDRMPAARRMFALTREPREVSRSLRVLDLPGDLDYELFREVTRDLVKFEYEQLFNIEYLGWLWAQIAGPAMFPVERAERLISMNVQRDWNQLMATVRATYLGEQRWHGR